MDALARGRISIYIGAGGQSTDTRLQTHVCKHTFACCWEVFKSASTIRITAVLDGRMLNQTLVDSDLHISITRGR